MNFGPLLHLGEEKNLPAGWPDPVGWMKKVLPRLREEK